MNRSMLGCAMAMVMTFVCGSSVAVAQDVAPLTEEQKNIFHGSKEDPSAMKLFGVNQEYEGRSYLAGDEWNLHLYHPRIKEIGGGYVGVGSDQGYMMVSWQRPEFAWLVDYDPLVVVTHKIYKTFFLEAKTPEAFYALWTKSEKDNALALIERDWADDENFELLKKVYKDWRPKILRRHKRIKRKLKKQKISWYLSDQESYDYMRGMIREGRIRPMLANLIDDEGIRGIGEASRKLGAPMRVIYMSNAQEYWKYPQEFRDNAASWNVDERSVVLHTLSTWSKNKDYRYVIQPAANFQAWMAEPWVKKVYSMVPRRKLKGPDDIDFIEFDKDVAAVKARRDKRAKKKSKKK